MTLNDGTVLHARRSVVPAWIGRLRRRLRTRLSRRDAASIADDVAAWIQGLTDITHAVKLVDVDHVDGVASYEVVVHGLTTNVTMHGLEFWSKLEDRSEFTADVVRCLSDPSCGDADFFIASALEQAELRASD